jgi:hypothetical protein
MQLIPKNWVSFQHYKHRSPPWIKFHRSILNDRSYMSLPLASKALAPLMWLLASESKDGTFDGSLDELVFRLHITQKDYQDGVKPLIDKGFFVIASGVLAECVQVAIPELETEREKETEKRQRATIVATPYGVSQSVWQEFVNHRKSKKAQVTQLVIDGIQKEADKAGVSLEDALKEVVVRNWQGFKAEWVLPKPTFGDMARVSVAPVQGRDPALLKLDEDRKHTGPPPPEIMAQIRNALKGKVS